MSFKSISMERFRIYANAEKKDVLVDALYSFGAVHITPAKEVFSKEKASALNSFQQISSELLSLRAVEKILGLTSIEVTTFKSSLGKITKKCKELNYLAVLEKNKELLELKSKENDLNSKIQVLTPFKHLKIAPALIRASNSIEFAYFELLRPAATLSAIKNDFQKLKVAFEIHFVKNNDENFALVAFEKRQAQTMQIVQKYAKRILQIPNVELSSFALEIHKLEGELRAVKGQIEEIQSFFEDYKKTNGKTLVETRFALEFESSKAQLPFNFAVSRNVIAVEGWIPSKIASSLQSETSKKLNSQVYVEFIKTKELAPTLLNNRKPVDAFEELVKFFALPKSSEIDPTALVAISFPLFFGMIVGDIGYGIVALLMASYVYLKLAKNNTFMKAFSTMLAISAISSIIFGVIFAEFFGFEHIFGFKLSPLIHRLDPHGLDILMSLSILFGMLHLTLGFILGIHSAFKDAHYKHAVGKLAWLTLMWSLVLSVISNLEISFFQLLNPVAHALPSITWLAILLLSIIAIAIFEGVTNLFEIPGILSNIFSYLRIMALGVSGVVIVYILNLIPSALKFSDPISLIGAILLMAVYIVGQVAGIVLALFESMIQSMRLQYVEFFSKFFEGGGISFNPLDASKVRVRNYK